MDDDDEAEQDPLRDTVSGHKADLEALREQDPSFYDYLKEADSDLLAFGDSMDLPSSSDDDEALEPPQVCTWMCGHSSHVTSLVLSSALCYNATATAQSSFRQISQLLLMTSL
jgi:hypothetical protein